MTMFARQPLVEMSLPEGVFGRLQRTKDFVTEAAHNLAESVHQGKDSVAATAEDAVNSVTHITDKTPDIAATAQRAANSVTTAKSESAKMLNAITQQAKGSLSENVERTKSSLEQTLQTAQKLSSKTSEAIQTGINSSIDQWLQTHPTVFRLLQLLLWAAEHPIVSLVVLLFGIAIAWSFIRAIGRLIDTVGWSLLQAPFKLSQLAIRVGWRSLSFNSSAVKQLASKHTQPPILRGVDSHPTHNHKRLAEIAARLEVIQKEQRHLLEEVAALLDSKETHIKN